MVRFEALRQGLEALDRDLAEACLPLGAVPPDPDRVLLLADADCCCGGGAGGGGGDEAVAAGLAERPERLDLAGPGCAAAGAAPDDLADRELPLGLLGAGRIIRSLCVCSASFFSLSLPFFLFVSSKSFIYTRCKRA